MENNIKIVFFGSTNYSVIVAHALLQSFGLSVVVTLNDRPDKRSNILIPNPVKTFGLKNNIPVITTDTLDTQIIATIKNYHPDFLVVLDYGLIVPDELLQLPKFAALNVHPSLLPKYRGPSPVPSAILAGEKTSGVTIIEMTSDVDAGDMLAQKTYTIKPDDTTDSLLTTLDTLGGEIIVEVINDYMRGTVKKTQQDEAQANFTQKYQKSDAYIDRENPPDKEQVDRMIRAFYPWLDAWTIVSIDGRNTRIKLLPGNKLQVEGKNPMTLKDFFNGYPQVGKQVAQFFNTD
jgi:methionyl-tRNA formyltransferase